MGAKATHEGGYVVRHVILALPCDVGFDLRATDTVIDLSDYPDDEVIRIEFLDIDDQPVVFDGFKDDVLRVLRQEGYVATGGVRFDPSVN